MSVGTNLARNVAKRLLDYVDRAETSGTPESGLPELPSIPENAYGQLMITRVLADAPAGGLPVSALAEQTGMKKDNVSEKLHKLRQRGHAEEVPDTWPPHWRLTPTARQAASSPASGRTNLLMPGS